MTDHFDRAIRRGWLDHVVTACQLVAGQALLVDRDDARQLLMRFVRGLTLPSTHIERMLLRGLLLDAAYRCSSVLHERAHAGEVEGCDFVCATLLDTFWQGAASDPADTFFGWIDVFFAEFDRTHPPSVAIRVSELIRQEYARTWTLAVLARRFNLSSLQLRRTFRGTFGISIQEYQRTIRLAAAIDDVRHAKIDALALRIGYRSRKNFYRAFRRLTGMTISEFRDLPFDRALHIQEAAKLQFARHRRSIA